MATVTRLDPRQELGLEREAIPRHIAIIMDGNGRWARQRGRPRIEGHIHGTVAVREIVTHCARLGIGALTLYSFSVDNWKRPKHEVDALMALYAEHLVRERQDIMEHDIRLRSIGRRQELPAAVVRELEITEAQSRGNKGMTLCLALNYGARTELVDAVRRISERVLRGELAPTAIDETVISESLYTWGIEDPDLVVRTAGELRLSNFLLWQISYAELYSSPVLWPDFRAADLNEAIRSFAARERRYGGLVQS
ncbi:MAG: isoprenyl transferase [Phycisphaerae bacterium]